MIAWWANRRIALSPPGDPTSLGNILLRMGFVTLEQLRDVMQKQRSIHPEGDQLLGELFISSAALTRDQLLRALDEQVKARKRPDLASLRQEVTKIVDMARAKTQRASASVDELKDEILRLTEVERQEKP